MFCRRFLFLIIFVFLFKSSALFVFAYDDKTTHPAITDEVVDFYNLLNPQKPLTNQEKEWIIEGSILEDTPPRWINHFYDPIRNEGLTGEKAGSYSPKAILEWATAGFLMNQPVSAVDWSNNKFIQEDYERYRGDRTWKKALNYYADGNYEEAYKTLGQIIHLLEDMTVPEHTRNDTHAHELEKLTGDYGSPYEEYLKKYNRQTIKELQISDKLKNSGITPPSLNSIEDYLIALANYSNKYFFSKDTINDPKYSEPKIIRDDGNFGYGKDENGKEFYLTAIKTEIDQINQKITKNFYIPTNNENQKQKIIIDAYFSRLSRQAVLYSAGAINLFFQKAREEIENREYPAHIFTYDTSKITPHSISLVGEFFKIVSFGQKAIGQITNFFSQSENPQTTNENKIENAFLKTESNNKIPIQTINQAVGNNIIEQLPNQPDQIPEENHDAAYFIKTLQAQSENIKKIIYKEQNENINQELNQNKKEDVQTKTIIQQNIQPDTEEYQDVVLAPQNDQIVSDPKCAFENFANQTPTHQIIFNEINWMGDAENPRHEWIELKNPTNAEINLNGWQILDKKGNIKINFSENDKISGNNFYFLERSNDDSAADIKADKIYSGALSNSNVELAISNNFCSLIDKISASPNWPAGDNSSKKTMERKDDLSWQTSLSMGGTPKKENSMTIIYSGGGGGGGVSATTAPISNSQDSQSQNISDNSTSTQNQLSNSNVNHILISEIYPDKTGNNFDFVEIYNPTDSPIDLKNYSLKILKEGATSTGPLTSFSANNAIASKSFFLIGLDNYGQSTSTSADVSRSSYSLTTNKSATIILYEDANSIDEINYNPANFSNGQSLERKSFSDNQCAAANNSNEFLGNGCDTDSETDFEIRSIPNPQNSQNFPEPRNAPTTPQNFAIAYASSSLTLNFSWNASQNYFGASGASSITYKITDISASSTFSTIETTSTTATIAINENNFSKTYDFSIQAFDRENLNSTSSTASISIPSATLIIAKQLDKSAFEQGDGNGNFYQTLGSGLLGSPKNILFHAKIVSEGVYYPAYYLQANFWMSDNPDYSSSTLISTNGCYRIGNYGASYGIADGNCDNLNNFEIDVDKDYIIPVQQTFTFDPSKYYKLKFITYQDHAIFYGSNDSASYIYGKATRYDGNASNAEIDAGIKDLYFSIDSSLPIEIPANISQSIPQNFELNYSTSTLVLSLSWDKPKYFNDLSPALSYKIIDISFLTSTSSLILPEITTAATSTTITISEVGRKYKFSIQGYDANGNSTLTTQSREIFIPHSLLDQFIMAKQTDYSTSEIGTGNGQFYQTLGNGLSGKLGAIAIKISAIGYYAGASILQYSDSNYSNLENNVYDAATCAASQYYLNLGYGGVVCSDYYVDDRTITIIPAKTNIIFDPAKYYKIHFGTYQSQSTFYGSSDANSYVNGQSSKDNGQGTEIATSPLQDLYFVVLSSTPH
ncbi:lamin tail domain-containing protein [Candidatus Wolfebacteria bacterium]|nr:lamin tail domain-containing protein [Candidatus Wolfebacteria bacterium]